MTKHGLFVIDRAKENGSWFTLDKSDNHELPKELTDCFKSEPITKTNFYKLPPSYRRAVLEWLYSAKTEPTRKRRIEKTIACARKGLRPL